ncbi:MAG: LysR family transcriptional regulator [Candidatus Cellulosilyticum pullistercoris]|uniref:LysR family transcriptional regulator n=1 Tax=Candidatus Cellulosilyticum pullistercoris TaxID=2838521 RepID=A0A9E2NMF5_9FIRM|nr:LysR family transcriptional regulator [Candidatus Cellulosilyticum pullistercoris]
MNFEQLKFFVEVYNQKCFSYAAEKLSISQSSLSKQIKSLEVEIGILLFDTTNKRNFVITEAGHDFYHYARKLLMEYDEMRSSMKKYLSLEKGHVSIASIPIKAQYGVVPRLTRFINDHPHININFMEEDSDSIINEIHNNKIDLGILYDSPKLDAIANTFPLDQDEFVAVIPQGHHLFNEDKINLSDLRNDQFILLKAGTDIYYAVIDLCQRNGFTPQARFHYSRTTTIIHMMEETKCVSILLKEIVKPMLNDNMKMIPLTDTTKLKLVLAIPKGRSLKPSTVILKNYMLKPDHI